MAFALLSPKSSTVTLSGLNSPKLLTIWSWLTSFKGCSKVGAANPLLPSGEAKNSRSLIASDLFLAYLATPPALMFTWAGFGVITVVYFAYKASLLPFTPANILAT